MKGILRERVKSDQLASAACRNVSLYLAVTSRPRHDFDLPLPIFQIHCGTARTHSENEFSSYSAHFLNLRVPPCWHGGV